MKNPGNEQKEQKVKDRTERTESDRFRLCSLSFLSVSFRSFCSKYINALILFLATGAYLSYIPGWVLSKFARQAKHGGEGLIGSIEGVLLIFIMPRNAGLFLGGLILAALAAFWICGQAEKILGHHDDGRIILDEVLGMMAAAFLLPHSFKAIAVAFLLFRVFDVLKVFPCNLFEKLPGGFGVVTDDLCAGVLANLAARLIV